MNDPAAPNSAALAATLILMRQAADGPPELLMLERASSMAFAAGALVFPGGRMEEGDLALADRLSGDVAEREEMAQRIAAIRETIEEAGLAIGIDPAPLPPAMNALRNGLARGRDFAELLDEAAARIDPDRLVPFARWRPPETASRRFDTRFFVAEAPPEAIESADGNESVRAIWASARSLLDDAEAGHHRIIFPTWCTLARLAQFSSFAEACADGARYGHHLASGSVKRDESGEWLCVDEGIGYPLTRRPLDDDLRG